MSFGGFRIPNGGGERMVAEGLFSYNSAISQPPLSLALAKMESLGEMNILGDFDGGRNREDELEFDNFEDDHDNNTPNNKRKKYHRHTPFQIQELETSFKDNPHPDEKARLELGKRLGLEGRQVKFWFQNRRTQMKTQIERHENSLLKQENDKLRIENIHMKEAMRSPLCENCGSPAILGEVPMEQHHLMIENARLKNDLKMFQQLSVRFMGGTDGSKLDLLLGMDGFCGPNSMDSGMPVLLDFGNRASNSFSVMPHSRMSMMSLNAPFDKSLFLELAMMAMDELVKLSQLGSPLWLKTPEGNRESLNLDEYTKIFSPCIGAKPGHFVSEATRASGNTIVNVSTFVETMMDVKQWTEMFPWNIGSALILDVISSGTGGSRNGALLLMQAEFQIPSQLVPVRQMRFIRFCKQQGDDTWAIVDVSVDSLFHANMPVNCRRLPSGCIMQYMPNGCSKVTWIEHTEYNEDVVHHLYQPLLRSGIAFGAQKWLVCLQRQSELFNVIVPSMPSPGDQIAIHPNGKRSMVKLAQRMTRSFCTGVCSTVNKWEGVQGIENTKVMMRKSFGNCGEPHGVILSATTTVWMPVLPHDLFDFLQDEKTRSSWDVLSQDGPLQQMLCISKAQDVGNCISLLRTNAPNVNQNNVLILQETSMDSSGSLIVRSGVDAGGMNIVMNGGDSSALVILPSGFSIMPGCFPESDEAGAGGGSLLTVGFQMLVSQGPAAELTLESVETVKSLISRTLQGIKDGLNCN